MRLLKRYRFLLYVLLPFIALAGIRYLPGNHFHPDARGNAYPAFTGENMVHRDSVDMLRGELLLLEAVPGSVPGFARVKELKRFKGKIVIVYENPSEAAIAWMILAQQGVRDLYIATDIGSGEEFEYEFRPTGTE